MSVQTYNYDFKFPWTLNTTVGGSKPVPSDDAAIADVTQGINQVAAQKFAEKMATTGHWYRVNNTTTHPTIVRKQLRYIADYPLYEYDFTGTTILNFDTDVQDPMAHNSPQLWETLLAIIGMIGLAITPTTVALFLIVVIIAAIVIGAVILINTGTGAIYQLGSNIGSLVLSLGVLAVVGFGIYAIFFTKTGKQTRQRVRSVARQVRRRK